jgi:hypothetical protein
MLRLGDAGTLTLVETASSAPLGSVYTWLVEGREKPLGLSISGRPRPPCVSRSRLFTSKKRDRWFAGSQQMILGS